MRKDQNNTLLEEDEQFLLVQYLELNNFKFTALPLDTFTRNWGTKMKNKKIGVRSGVPDMLIIIKGKLVFIEMKRKKGGTVSKNQKEWVEKLNECDSVSAYVCKGFDEAKIIVDKYANKEI